MILLDSPHQAKQYFSEVKSEKKTIGFVPTMGALHAGHGELVKTALRENDLGVVSIYVNPTQFNQKSDFEKYPAQLDDDLKMLKSLGAHAVFAPRDSSSLYPDQFRYQLALVEETKYLEDLYRPGHFSGVLSVVMKLLQIIQPTRAYFGEKDYQQYHVISQMAEAYFLDSEIIPCETIREPSGLAMSSRNVRLSPDGRKKAAEIYRVLKGQGSLDEMRKLLTSSGFKVEYLDEMFGRRLVAAWLEEVRLIDNVKI